MHLHPTWKLTGDLVYGLAKQAFRASQVVKNLPANAGNIRDAGWIRGSGRSPGEEMATHSSIHSWKILWSETPGRLQSMGS